GKEFMVEVGKHLLQLCKVFKMHVPAENSELSSAALQALGFCLFNSKLTSQLSETEMEELLSAVNSVAVKTSDKNTRTRALWVISKQTFPSEVVGKAVPSIISTLETILNKGDVHSMVVEYEALNVVIRLIEQSPAQMGEKAVCWAKLIIPLVVHSAHKVQLRGAAALEMGMPLLLQKQQEVAAITEELMTTKIILELQKLFSSKNETYVLKLWPLFVNGSFINSLLQLEELGFRSGSPVVKKIAFIAWKSLIDNFALNPDILCSAKRLKLLMQPLSSIHVRTDTLALTKLEVWWYLLMRLGPQLPANFEQVCVPLIQSTLSTDSLAVPPSRVPANQSSYAFGSPVTPRMNLNSSVAGMGPFPSIQLLGIEMLLHFFMGPEVLTFAKQNKLVLGLEPLQHPLISSHSFFCKHASTFINAVQDGFIAIGKESSGSKRERQGSEVLTMLLQALKNIVASSALPVLKTLSLIEIKIKELPPKVLGSPAYQVANMDLLNGTPALFLIQLSFHDNLLEFCVTDERFFLNLEALVGYVLSGPTSPLAFSESVFCIINQCAKQLENKEHLWRTWSLIVNPLTNWINQTNEVNQGDALEYNFNAIYSALLMPINNIFPVGEFPQPTMKSLLRTWSELYRTFARCASLVATAEENVCCEELCSKIIAGLDDEALENLSMMDGLTYVVSVMVDCINFAPYGTKYQPKNRSPQTPTDWSKKKKEPLGKLTSLFKLLVMLINSFHTLSSKDIQSEALVSVGTTIIGILHNIIGHISLHSVITTAFAMLTKPLSVFYEKTKLTDVPRVYNSLSNKLEKLLGEIMLCLQSHYTGSYDSELLEQLSPLLCIIFLHKSKQIRNQIGQFWNATFAKAAVLTYHEELTPVLSQAKQKSLLLLPGFESIEIVGESSGPYSDSTENSQWDPKISGIEVKSGGKRDSLLTQANELKEKSTHLKLEFSSSKTKQSEMPLEEENTLDFVFIPPETKERILTEHQKEVLKTKRTDIPTMYNNLDASQDTTLFSQYTQIKSAMHNAQKITEDCKSGKIIEKTTPVKTEDQTSTPVKENSESLQFEIPIPEADSKELSAVDAAVNENTSNVSSSSASSDVVSGTPQPVSRRQSFITLEKFDSSENRPFSPSALNNATETLSKEKVPKEENKRNSKSEGIFRLKRSSRRQNKTEPVEYKKPKLSARSEQEKSVEGSTVAMHVDSKSDLPYQMEGTNGILDTLSQTPECTTMENKQIVDNVTEIEKSVGPNLDSKENTPPEVAASLDKISNDDGQIPQMTPNQKTLRRSLRRRSETTEGTLDSQDKENSHQKKDKCKDDEKSLQKRVPQIKDDASLKQKSVSEKATDVQGNANKKESTLHEKTVQDVGSKSCASGGLDEEVNTSSRKLEGGDSKCDMGDVHDSGSETADQKKARGRPRYQTRRASQGLLSSIENSESDSSETREDGSKRKRSRKWKNKSGSLESEVKEGKPESQSQEPSSQKSLTESKSSSDAKSKGESDSDVGMETELVFETSEVKNKTTCMLVDESSGNKDFAKGSVGGEITEVELNKTNKSSMSPGIPVPILKTRQATKMHNMQDSAQDSGMGNLIECSKGDVSVTTAAASLPSEKPSQVLCLHKRSKRMRRSKSCDCCEKSPQQEKPSPPPQEKVFTGLKNADNQDLKPNASPETCAEGSHSEETFSAEPCATSTPLLLEKESTLYFKDSEKELKSEKDLQGNTFAVEEDMEKLACVKRKTCEPVSETQDHMNEADKTPEQCSAEHVSNESIEQCLDFANDVNKSVATVKEEIPQEDQPEEGPDAEVTADEPEEMNINEPEEIKTSESKTAVQNEVEKTGEISFEVPCPQDSERNAEALISAETTCACMEPESTASEQESADESSNVDSPQKLKESDSFALVKVSESPSGVQTRCTWSPSASPSTSILKRGIKRHQEDDSPSPVNKIRRVSFANPIYQEGLADDIDRRSPVVRSHSSNSSPSSRSSKTSSNTQTKITEMVKESLPSPTESVYPALVGCKASVDIILPQITSNIWARGLGQLIRAKNIKTVGDLSTLSATEIKTLPIRSPKVSNVKKALRGYHEQQVKSRGFEEIAALEDTEKPVNGIDDKHLPTDEEKHVTDLIEPATSDTDGQPATDLLAQISSLEIQLTSEDLHNYSGSQLFEMQEKLCSMTNCVMKNLQSRWTSPPHEHSD
uniref:Replication timing regulatory factor 1 n=1 Tax=Sphenodon punctatus TaxID=8508 RepID=A0A8D0GBL2_SPHPU